jgi:hypothetical protein
MLLHQNPCWSNGNYPWSYGCYGEETYNQNLSLARANDVKNIIENSLSKAE